MSDRVIAVDPGDRHVGVAVGYLRDGVRRHFLTTNENALDMIFKVQPEILVVENYRIRRSARFNSGSTNATSMLIADLKSRFADDSRFHLQEPGIKGSTARTPWWKEFVADSDMRTVSTHEQDAVLHLIHFIHVRGGK